MSSGKSDRGTPGEDLPARRDDSGEVMKTVRVPSEKDELLLLRSLLDSVPALVAYVGADRSYKLVSRGYSEWLGAAPEDIVGRAVESMLGKEAYDGVRAHIDAALSGQKVSFDSELAYEHGGRRQVQAAYLPDVDDAGRVRGYVSWIVDSHAATTAAEQRYRALSESAPLLVWTTSVSGELDYVNQRFVDYTGLSIEQLRRREPHSIMHPADDALFGDVWTSSLRSGKPLEVEYRLRRHDGAYRWFLTRGTAVLDTNGTIVRWVGSCTDIDDRKRAEQLQRFLAEAGALLSSSLDYKNTLAEIARLAVPTLALACVIDGLNEQGALETLAFSSEGARHTLATHLFRAHGSWLGHEELIRHVIGSAQTLRPEQGDGFLLRPVGGGEDEAFDWIVAPVIAQQRVLGTLTLLTPGPGYRFDHSHVDTAEDLGRRTGSVLENARLYELAQHERKRAEDASRAKDLFLGTLSHELRTPLSAILGWTRMLQSGTLPEDKRERALETIERNARVQVAMIEDVLDLARITSGKLRLDVAPVDVAQVIDAAIDTIRPSADAKGVRIQAVLDPDAGPLHGDGPRLQQIAWNLLSNAVKFTPKGGRVYVLLRRVDSSVEVVVSDTGSGILPEFLPYVFERFSQADPTRTRRQGGLGLGLSIVKHLTELHGGAVFAESAGAGQGATFTVRLPLAPLRDTPVTSARASALGSRAEPRASTPGSPAESRASTLGSRAESRASTPAANRELFCPPELDNLHVLIVDDEPDARALVQSVLEACKARVTVARSAAEAFELLKRERPHVLVSDIGMPDEDGYSLIRRIRALPEAEGGRTPAVALTAYAHITDRTRALMEGFNNHVSKPAEPEELVAVVSAVAGRHGAKSPT